MTIRLWTDLLVEPLFMGPFMRLLEVQMRRVPSAESAWKDLGVAGSSVVRKDCLIQPHPSKADHDLAGWKEARMGHSRANAA